MIPTEQHASPAAPGRIRRFYIWVLHWADTPYGFVALLLVAFSESSFFPLPPDPLLLALALARPQRAVLYALACSGSSVLGGLVGYALGWGLWESLDTVFFAYVPGVTPEVFALVGARYNEYGFWAVFSAGFTPIPYKVFTIAAGVFELPLGVFLVASILGRSARFVTLGALIWRFGEPIQLFIHRYFNVLSVVFVVLLLAGFLVIKLVL